MHAGTGLAAGAFGFGDRWIVRGGVTNVNAMTFGRRTFVSDYTCNDHTRLQNAQFTNRATARQLLRGLEQVVSKCGL